MNQQPLEVVALVLENKRQHILLAQRPLEKHQGGLWEFPGGKVEHGEDLISALQREIQEELNYLPRNPKPLIKVTHSYPDLTVRLNIFHEQADNPQVMAAEQQPLNWVDKQDLYNQSMPAADKAILDAIVLPNLLETVVINQKQQLPDINPEHEYILQIDHLPHNQQAQVLKKLKDHKSQVYRTVQANFSLFPDTTFGNEHYSSPKRIPEQRHKYGLRSAHCKDEREAALAVDKNCDFIVFAGERLNEFDRHVFQRLTESISIPMYAYHPSFTSEHITLLNDIFAQGIITKEN